eukprot:363049-Chlamydomonas_euryale.AAC.17
MPAIWFPRPASTPLWCQIPDVSKARGRKAETRHMAFQPPIRLRRKEAWGMGRVKRRGWRACSAHLKRFALQASRQSATCPLAQSCGSRRGQSAKGGGSRTGKCSGRLYRRNFCEGPTAPPAAVTSAALSGLPEPKAMPC